MFSGEAQSFLNETKSLLYSLSKFIVPEDQIEGNVNKILSSIKALMTDRTALNTTFF